MKQSTITPAVGSIVAWESQAAGSWKTKIGRVVHLPREGAMDGRNTSSKYRILVLASYDLPTNKRGEMFVPTEHEVESLRERLGIKVFRNPDTHRIGVATGNQIRIPKRWELELAEGA